MNTILIILAAVLGQVADYVVKKNPKLPDIIRPYAATLINGLTQLLGVSIAHAGVVGAVGSAATSIFWSPWVAPIWQNALAYYVKKLLWWHGESVRAAYAGQPLPGQAGYNPNL